MALRKLGLNAVWGGHFMKDWRESDFGGGWHWVHRDRSPRYLFNLMEEVRTRTKPIPWYALEEKVVWACRSYNAAEEGRGGFLDVNIGMAIILNEVHGYVNDGDKEDLHTTYVFGIARSSGLQGWFPIHCLTHEARRVIEKAKRAGRCCAWCLAPLGHPIKNSSL